MLQENLCLLGISFLDFSVAVLLLENLLLVSITLKSLPALMYLHSESGSIPLLLFWFVPLQK